MARLKVVLALAVATTLTGRGNAGDVKAVDWGKSELVWEAIGSDIRRARTYIDAGITTRRVGTQPKGLIPQLTFSGELFVIDPGDGLLGQGYFATTSGSTSVAIRLGDEDPFLSLAPQEFWRIQFQFRTVGKPEVLLVVSFKSGGEWGIEGMQGESPLEAVQPVPGRDVCFALALCDKWSPVTLWLHGGQSSVIGLSMNAENTAKTSYPLISGLNVRRDYAGAKSAQR